MPDHIPELASTYLTFGGTTVLNVIAETPEMDHSGEYSFDPLIRQWEKYTALKTLVIAFKINGFGAV